MRSPSILPCAHEFEDSRWVASKTASFSTRRARKSIDVEEAPIVDVVGGDAPVGEPIGLRFQQLMQGIEAGRLVGVAARSAHSGFDGLRQRCVGGIHLRQARACALPFRGGAPVSAQG